MRIARTAIVVSSLVMAAAVSLGEAAQLIERAGTVPFDGDGFVPATPAERWSIPFEDQAA